MSACPDKAMLLQGLLDGELDAVNAQACEAHLKTCAACDAEFRRALDLRAAVTAPGVAHRAPESLRAGIDAMLAAETAPPVRAARRIAPWAASGLGGLLAAGLAVMLILPQVTEAGVRNNVSVPLQYLESWLRGVGAAAIYNLMEDAATAEISRAQVWQWIHLKAKLDDGRDVTPKMFRDAVGGEMERVKGEVGAKAFDGGRFKEATELFSDMSLSGTFDEFLTLPAYKLID